MMDSVTERLHEEAIRRSRRVVHLWRRSQLAITANERDRRDRVEEAIELNMKAIDDCVAALNTLAFLRRFEEETPLGKTFR